MRQSPSYVRFLTRRAFLGVVGKAAIIFGFISFGGLVRALSQKNGFIRPPGAVVEAELLPLCIKCQKCQQVCHTGTITPVVLIEDIASVGTPKLDFHLGYCDLCMRCIEVCPTGALLPTKKENVRLGIAQIDRERCIAFTWRGCIKCYKECPFEAITLDSNQRPIVDENRCNGCGLCEYICPSSSLRGYTSASGKGIVVTRVGVE